MLWGISWQTMDLRSLLGRGVAVGTVLLIIIIHKLHCHIVVEWGKMKKKN